MRKFSQIAGFAMAAVLAAVPCFAADSAILRNGFSIRHERRQVIGTVTRLYLSSDNSSFVDIPTADIDHFEAAPVEVAKTELDTLSTGKLAEAQSSSQSKSVAPPLDLNEVVRAASGTYKLDPDLVNSVIRAESGFDIRAVSPKGAQGLMQLMPQTASQMGVQNILDPKANVEGGTRYLRELLERYNFDLIKALAAYNAGPQRVEQYGGVPPYSETKAYVARIVRDYNKKIAAKNAAQSTAKKNAANKSAAPHVSHPAGANGKVQAKASGAPSGGSN
jgi:Transglycosylase SLT domain